MELFAFLCLLGISQAAYQLQRIATFTVQHPAFTTLYKDTSVSGSTPAYNLVISTFAPPSPFAHNTDTVNIVRNVGAELAHSGTIHPVRLTTNVVWPNEVTRVPDGVFSHEMLVIPDGFLVPFKTAGNIRLLDISGNQAQGPYVITNPSGGDWFYHRAQWKDMDGDGDLDVVTCRAREPALGFGKDEELLWLENPAGDVHHPWKEHVLAHGPDSFFTLTRLSTSDGMKDCILAAQFFTKSLSIYWSANGHFTDPAQVQKRVVADNIGAVFDIEHVDLNNDGRLDFLVTTNGGHGTLLAFEVPDDFRTGTFTKHVIATGFTPRSFGIGKGAPGSAFAFYPTGHKSRKPLILISGDDDGRAYKFEAASEAHSDWTYVKDTFCDAGSGTVGQISAADVNGDGNLEVFVPSYSTNQVFVYSMTPTGAPVLG